MYTVKYWHDVPVIDKVWSLCKFHEIKSSLVQICSSPNLKEATVIVWDWLWSWKPRIFCDEVCVNAELWWTWQVLKCPQWHDSIVLNIQWYGMICFLRYAWWCSHILSNKSNTIQGMLVWWYVCCKVMIHSYILWWQWYDATWFDACFGMMTHFYALWCVHITWWWWVHILDDIDANSMMMHVWWMCIEQCVWQW